MVETSSSSKTSYLDPYVACCIYWAAYVQLITKLHSQGRAAYQKLLNYIHDRLPLQWLRLSVHMMYYAEYKQSNSSEIQDGVIYWSN